ncbi:MAG: cysteine synthase family protein [Deltaproteobacteria bacterium]|nr:cysteine synthase family protein [Deltaproteobacteria bacterium]
MGPALQVRPARTANAAESVLDLVGNTPLLHLSRFQPKDGADLYAKLEFLNPGGSVKDRAALEMIKTAEATGHLLPGATIIEPTSGNTGVGLALVAVMRGYRVIVVMPEKFTGAKSVVMRALGAEIVLTPTAQGMLGAISRAKELVAQIPGSFMPQQFENVANPAAHYKTTGAEIYAQLGKVPDAVVLGAGTGGTFSGVARYLKERGKVHAVLVEPVGSVWGGGPAGLHKTEGIGQPFWPAVIERSLIDEILTISDEDSFAAVKELARREALLVGGSSGAAAHAAKIVAARLGKGATVVTLFPDAFERYLGKGIFENL